MKVYEEEDNEGFQHMAIDCPCSNHITYISQSRLLVEDDIKFCPLCGQPKD